MSYKVNIPAFEGPFDLLVYLIENAEMNIYDIQISEITSQYMEYLQNMKEMDFNVSAEFMVLAATLLDIKSKMILPRVSETGEIVVEEDPRSELVERLLEYRRYKLAAELLKEREEYGRMILEKPQEDISMYLNHPDEILNLDLKQFAEAFNLFLTKKKREEEVRAHYTEVEREKASIENRMVYIKNMFSRAVAKGIKRLNLRALIPDKKDRYDVVVTFVSVLQMIRDRYLDAEQKSLYGDITVMPGEKDMEEKTDGQ